MSFVDDLRNGRNEQEERIENINMYDISVFTERALEMIKGKCLSAQSSGRNSINGFLVKVDNPDTYGEYSVELRPGLQAPQAGTTDIKSGSKDAQNSRLGESSRFLYDSSGYDFYGDPRALELRIQCLDKGLRELGFSNYQVNLRKLNNPLIKEQIKMGLFVGKKTVTVENTGKTISAIEVVVHW